MVDSTVGIGSTHEPMVQRKTFPGFDPAMSHGLLAAITRTATTGALPPPGVPFAGVGRATPGPPASGLPTPPLGTEVVSVGRPPTPGDPGHPPPGRRLCPGLCGGVGVCHMTMRDRLGQRRVT